MVLITCPKLLISGGYFVDNYVDNLWITRGNPPLYTPLFKRSIAFLVVVFGGYRGASAAAQGLKGVPRCAGGKLPRQNGGV